MKGSANTCVNLQSCKDCLTSAVIVTYLRFLHWLLYRAAASCRVSCTLGPAACQLLGSRRHGKT